MKRLIVLGSTGMLGSEVSRVAKKSGIKVVDISRFGPNQYRAGETSLLELLDSINVGENDWLVNCVGWIPQKATIDLEANQKMAFLLNVETVFEIRKAQNVMHFNWIQILTDCVFDGSLGGYLEYSSPDAHDLYAKTKALGEKSCDTSIRLRCSIVGPDSQSRVSLFSWFLHEVVGGKQVVGFKNHFWNGISTTAFAKICAGILMEGYSRPVLQHLVPANSVSKFELLKIFSRELGFDPSRVIEGSGEFSKNMTLATVTPEKNKFFWAIGGYPEVPTVESLCAEFISIHFPDRSKRHAEFKD